MSIFSNLFNSDRQRNKTVAVNEEKPQFAALTDDDLPSAPPLTASIEERCKRDEFVSKGYSFAVTSDLTFIDDNGNCVHI